MNREELLDTLRDFEGDNGDPENAHGEADAALLAYIGDEEVSEAFRAIRKWYA